MKSKLIAFLLLSLFFSCDNRNKKYLGGDYRLFKDGPVWGLALPMKNNNIMKFKAELERRVYNLNFQESTYGNTLLMMTVSNNQIEMFKLLLENGANPNVRDYFNGESTIIQAIGMEKFHGLNSLPYVKLLLKYGANINDTLIGNYEEKGKGNTYKTVLMKAASATHDNIELVKYLVENGADINSSKCGKHSDPLRYAIGSENMKCAYYLLMKGAFFEDSSYINKPRDTVYCKEDKFRILKRLREHTFDLGSEKHICKMKIVAFLKDRGLDYFKEPISVRTRDEIYKKHQNDWDTYIEKY